ncbi:hypothetical protein FLK61_24430 [Paenalkalicoccus suaedae]|uniref:Uncharacterized protein n=1 Tax=Paenalkalicoccus suaedae TaxID=2592382 RepID=A0A859FB96_9BACI|nr:hypothetical protein [Paenalkalicoccus suaedae]QKS69931.1 hypothetical protein FLK61_24430 [Paenalkalicoccus suaedae]
MKQVVSLIVLVLFVAGCAGSTGNPVAAHVLENNEGADILTYGDHVFYNASNLAYLDVDSFEKVTHLGEIVSQPKNFNEYLDLCASVLDIGTPIYATGDTSDDMYHLIAEIDGEDILYIALGENR